MTIAPETYAMLSSAAYSNYGVPGDASNAWIRLENFQDEITGFSATLFENLQGERVLAFRGTNPFSIADWTNNIQVLNGVVPLQFEQAMELYNSIATQYGTENLTLTGHSLGGALASYVSAQDDSHPNSVVFNALGVEHLVPTGTYTNVTNYNWGRDPVSALGGQIGARYVIDNGIDFSWISASPLFGLNSMLNIAMYL